MRFCREAQVDVLQCYAMAVNEKLLLYHVHQFLRENNLVQTLRRGDHGEALGILFEEGNTFRHVYHGILGMNFLFVMDLVVEVLETVLVVRQDPEIICPRYRCPLQGHPGNNMGGGCDDGDDVDDAKVIMTMRGGGVGASVVEVVVLWWRVEESEVVGRIDPEMRIVLGVGRKNSPENYSGGRRAATAWWLAGGGGRP
ncbi:hypothetical protein Tco_1250345, partial [Tanacetum coccineum]